MESVQQLLQRVQGLLISNHIINEVKPVRKYWVWPLLAIVMRNLQRASLSLAREYESGGGVVAESRACLLGVAAGF